MNSISHSVDGGGGVTQEELECLNQVYKYLEGTYLLFIHLSE
jgi:hypothetical protein